MCPEERWKSSTNRSFCCVPCSSSAQPTCRPCPGHVKASNHTSTARGTKKICVHKYHSVLHDQREPSTVSTHDEDETDAGVRRPVRHEARLYHRLHKWRAIGAPPHPSINMLRMDSAVLQKSPRRRNAVLLNGLLDARRTKSRDCKAPGPSPD